MVDFGDDPYPEYACLREQEPVRHVLEGEGLYGVLVTRYEDVRMLLSDPRMSKDPRTAPADWQEAGKGRPLEDRTGLGTHLLTTDGPEHTRLRRLVSTAFTARRIEGLRGQVQQITDGLLDEIVPRGRVDLVTEFAFPLAITVICELAGSADGGPGGVPPLDKGLPSVDEQDRCRPCRRRGRAAGRPARPPRILDRAGREAPTRAYSTVWSTP